jgi:hypothetical protein
MAVHAVYEEIINWSHQDQIQCSQDKKQMVMALFTNCVLLGTTTNDAYIVMILDIFVKQKKAVVTVARQWFLCWDNALVHTATFVHQ